MKLLKLWIVLVGTALATHDARADDAAAKKELTPTGKLRVAVAVGPAPSRIYALKDSATGNLRSVTIDLSNELAKKLGVAIEFVPYRGSGETRLLPIPVCGTFRLCRSMTNARS